MLSHVIPQCLVTDRITIKLQLTGKSHLIFKLYTPLFADRFLPKETYWNLFAGKYFLYACCPLAKTVSLYIRDLIWFCLVLSSSARLPSGTMAFSANVRAIPFFRPNVPKSTEARNFLFLTTVCGVHSHIELHRKIIKS